MQQPDVNQFDLRIDGKGTGNASIQCVPEKSYYCFMKIQDWINVKCLFQGDRKQSNIEGPDRLKKSMTPCQETLFTVVPPSNSLISVLDP